MQLAPNPVNETATSSGSGNCKEYIKTVPTRWTDLKNDGKDGRTIEPIPFTGESEESEEFSVKITDEELAGVKDDNGDIWFSNVMEFCLICFDCDVLGNGAFGPERPPLGLWEWQVNQVANYMFYFIDHHGFKPAYYCPRDPVNPASIFPHCVSRLYGVKITNMLCGDKFVYDMYSTIEYFDAVHPVKESMPQDALNFLIQCMHFSDD